MDLHSTLQAQALQLKNTPRTLLAVAEVVQKIMKTLYEVSHFPNAADRRPGRNPEGPNERFFVLLYQSQGNMSFPKGYLIGRGWTC